MLWYKAWLETRSRFLVSLFAMVALPSYFVWHEYALDQPGWRSVWYYHTLHAGHGLVAAMWLLAVTLLMMGGLLREKVVGTAAFTLSLPMSRGRLMGVRVATGLAEAIALAVAPWVAMFLIAAGTGKANSVYQAWYHLVLLAGGGIVIFAVALLVSSLIEGEYTAPAVTIAILFLDIVALDDGPLQTISPWRFIVGTDYFNRGTQMLTGPIPWGHFFANLGVAILLTVISIRAIQRHEF